MKRTDAFKFVGLILLSGLAGAALLSVAVHIYTAVTHPRMLGDGQYGMVFMLTFPIGWLIGAAVYGMSVFTDPEPERPVLAGWIFAFLYVGGLIAMPLAGTTFLRLLSLILVRT